MEIVILDSMIENGAELIVDRFQIYRRIRLAAFILIIYQLILACVDLLSCYAAHFELTELWQELGSDYMFFR